jgi:hypothetical protein
MLSDEPSGRINEFLHDFRRRAARDLKRVVAAFDLDQTRSGQSRNRAVEQV